MQRLPLIFLFSILLFSCKEDENPDGRIPVSIEGFTLSSSYNPAGRLAADSEWQHTFGDTARVVFYSQTTGGGIALNFKPDFSGELPQVLLAPDTYHYQGHNGYLHVSPFLPVNLEGYLEVSAAGSVRLQAKTSHQLLSFHKDNLSDESSIIQPEKTAFFTQGDYYYAYVRPDRLFKAELKLKNGKTLNWGLDTRDFRHSSYYFKAAGSGAQMPPLYDPKLDLQRTTVNLDAESIPDQMPLYAQTNLDILLPEASGLQYVGQNLYAINDGENTAQIFGVSTTGHGGVIRRITVSNAQNTEWEDLASDGQYLYIGDFGNNLGTRTDLRILRIPLLELETKNTLEAEVIHFSYDRQTGASGADHRFDCEAMIARNGQLILFTKPTNAQGSDIYTLSATPGTQVARYAGSIETKGWITGADITQDGKHLLLLGYENKGVTSQAFVGLVKNAQLPTLAGSPVKTIYLGPLATTSQAEGISIDHNGIVKIAGEQINQSGLTIPQRMSELDLTGVLQD